MKTSIKIVAGLVIAVVAFLIGAFAAVHFTSPSITSDYVTGKLQNISELSTQQLTYTGIEHYEEGDIPLINKKTFNMLYTAKAKAGIDLADVQVDVTANEVKVTVPHATLQSVEVDADSIKFYDDSFTLFSSDGKQQTANAVSAAKKDFESNADYQELLDSADDQTAAVIKGLLNGQVGDREITVSYE